MSKLRIGVLRDMFDPPLLSVLFHVRSMISSSGLDHVLMIPSFSDDIVTAFDDRWKMLVAACSNDKKLLPFKPDCLHDPVSVPDLPDRFIREAYPRAILVPVSPDAYRNELSAVRHSLSLGIMPDGLDAPVREYICCKGLYGFPERFPETAVWLDDLYSALKPHRYAHSLSVALTARQIASRFGEDPDKAEKAGLLHDCAKHLPLAEMQIIAHRYHATDDPAFLNSTALLHSVVGACVAESDYGMHDPDILDAIRYHNTGKPGMSRLAMCVCLADSIEPMRRSFPLLDQVRLLSELSLEKALLLSLECTANYVQSKGEYLHPRTRETIAWLKSLPAVRNDISVGG